jgi:drug/metabolite transporter (DMT)-like permease
LVSFALWDHAPRHWPRSQVFLFNNWIPLRTMAWASVCLRKLVTPKLWLAMLLIVTGEVLGQTNWQKIDGVRRLPFE